MPKGEETNSVDLKEQNNMLSREGRIDGGSLWDYLSVMWVYIQVSGDRLGLIS